MGTVPTYLDECGADSACKDHDCNMPSVARAVAATWCDYEKKDDICKYLGVFGASFPNVKFSLIFVP